MLAIAIFTVSFLAGRRAHVIGLSKDTIYDFSFWMILSGIIGCRLFYIFLNFSYFIDNPSELIMVQHGGLAWQGGLIFGLFTAVVYTKKKRISFFKFADFVSPYIALGQSIGRWGCLLNGCCYGKELQWGIYDSVRGIHVHPTQIYLSIAAFVSFLILRAFYKKNKIEGRTFVLFFLIEAVSRFVIEFFRADHEILWAGLSIFQIVCIFLFIGFLYAYTFLSRRSRV